MSLKALHIVFVTASVLLALWFAGWSILNYIDGRIVADLIYGLASLTTAVALVFYGKYVLKKLKTISYL